MGAVAAVTVLRVDDTGDAAAAVRVGDPRLAAFARTADAELRDRGLFIGESRKVIERAMDAGARPRAILLEERLLDDSAGIIACAEKIDPAVPVLVATRAQFKAITGYEVVRSALCVFERPVPTRADELLGRPDVRRVAVLEDIGNATNIGAIFRSAAALGVDAVLVTPSCHDPLFRRAARVSMGTVFQVPWARIGGSRAWAADGVPLLRSHGFATAALALADDAVAMDDPRITACDRLALVLGTEGDGLAAETIAHCDWTVKIPMAHGVDSLNVAAASAVAFWETRVRQSRS